MVALHTDQVFILAFVREGSLRLMLSLLQLRGSSLSHIYLVVIVFFIVQVCYYLVGRVLVSV